MICAIELVKNKETKEPFSYEDGIGKKIYKKGLKMGALLRPMFLQFFSTHGIIIFLTMMKS